MIFVNLQTGQIWEQIQEGRYVRRKQSYSTCQILPKGGNTLIAQGKGLRKAFLTNAKQDIFPNVMV